MRIALTTNTRLPEGLRDPGNRSTWAVFCERYRPVLLAAGRRIGLNEHEAEDAAQEAMMALSTAYHAGRYDRDKGRLRSWLLGIASNKIRDVQRRRPREVQGGRDDSAPGLITA